MALTIVASVASSEPAMVPWASGTNQLSVLPTLTPRRSPSGLTRLSVVPATVLAMRMTVSPEPV